MRCSFFYFCDDSTFLLLTFQRYFTSDAPLLYLFIFESSNFRRIILLVHYLWGVLSIFDLKTAFFLFSSVSSRYYTYFEIFFCSFDEDLTVPHKLQCASFPYLPFCLNSLRLRSWHFFLLPFAGPPSSSPMWFFKEVIYSSLFSCHCLIPAKFSWDVVFISSFVRFCYVLSSSLVFLHESLSNDYPFFHDAMSLDFVKRSVVKNGLAFQ